MFIVIIDAGSKWIEVFSVQSTTAKLHLKPLFAQFGLPDIIAPDNCLCFISWHQTLEIIPVSSIK